MADSFSCMYSLPYFSMMMKSFVFVCSLLLLSFVSFAQTEDSVFIRRIADEILINSKAYSNLHTLTKQIGGRLAGSPGMVKAEQWGQRALRAAGADTVWLQQCMVPHWVRGGKDEATAITGNSKKTLDVVALGNSVGTAKNGITAAVVEVRDFDDLEKKKDQVKDKIVFYNYPFNPTFIRTFQAYSDAVKYRGQGPSRAAKYGAKAVIIRSMSHGANNFPHTGSTKYTDSTLQIPAVAVGLQDADWLSNVLKSQAVSATVKTAGHFLPDTIGHNIIGEIKGSQFPNEYITVGGHLDSWDVNEGAHDDGTGVVQTIEVMRALQALGYQPKHTIRFVLFANEENGLRGGTKYAEEAKEKGEHHIFALESDNGGFTPRGFSLVANAAQSQKIKGWRDLLEPYGTYEFLTGAGSDVTPLNSTQGVPVGELLPDSQRYFDLHHARNDVFEAVDKRELELGAVNMAGLIYLIDKYGL